MLVTTVPYRGVTEYLSESDRRTITSSGTLQLTIAVGNGGKGGEKEDGATIAKKVVLPPVARINISQIYI